MVRYTLKILQQMLQDFLSVSDHFRKLCIKVLNPSEDHKEESHYRVYLQCEAANCSFRISFHG